MMLGLDPLECCECRAGWFFLGHLYVFFSLKRAAPFNGFKLEDVATWPDIALFLHGVFMMSPTLVEQFQSGTYETAT